MIAHNRPTLGLEEAAAASRVIGSGWIAQGKEVEGFEAEFARRLGLAPPGVATASGASALHLALLALGIGPGDQVLLPTYVCSAVLNPVRYVGAEPLPCEARAGDFNLDPQAALARRGAKTRAAILVHTFGVPAQVRPFLDAGLVVIEDCAQALGAVCGGRPVGTLAPVAVFSFNATKPITTGAGGMLVSSDPKLLERARDLREYDKRPDYKVRHNCQMTDLAAAIGRVQMKRLPEFLDRRIRIARRYREALEPVPGIRFQEAAPGDRPFPYRFVLRTARPAAGLCQELRARGVEAIQPIAPYQMLHRYLDLAPAAFPAAEAIARDALSLPIYPSLTDEEQDRVLAAVKEVLL